MTLPVLVLWLGLFGGMFGAPPLVAFTGSNKNISPVLNQNIHRQRIPVKHQNGLRSVEPGTWGNFSVKVVIERNSANFDFNCAEGWITVPLRVDKHKHFREDGEYKRLTHGPIHLGKSPTAEPAIYDGNISGTSMTFTITLTRTKELIGEFKVERGRNAKIIKCR